MPSFSTAVFSLLIPAAAVLAGSFMPTEPMGVLRREDCMTTYISKDGDNCNTVDEVYGLVPGTTSLKNTWLLCSDIWAGTPICVPDGPYNCWTKYISNEGDTCHSIEVAFEVEDGDVLYANDFLDCNNIQPGTELRIPECDPHPLSGRDYTDAPASCTVQTYTSELNDTWYALV
jgi:hypothetical protein